MASRLRAERVSVGGLEAVLIGPLQRVLDSPVPVLVLYRLVLNHNQGRRDEQGGRDQLPHARRRDAVARASRRGPPWRLRARRGGGGPPRARGWRGCGPARVPRGR